MSLDPPKEILHNPLPPFTYHASPESSPYPIATSTGPAEKQLQCIKLQLQ